MDLLAQFIKNWKAKGFVPDGQTVLLAVSCGIDSMVMADLFLNAEIPFAIAHCNFQLRGEEADKDEALVSDWANKNNVRFHHVRFDTKQKSVEWKKGTQETARILRYEWLGEIRKGNGYAKLVTAHHANDNVETLLMNLFKGTGIAGMHGIPETNDQIIRPLLFAQREDIAAYATANNISFRDDASNATDTYLRNAVRLNIIPVIKDRFPNVIQNVNESINRFAQAEMLYKKAVERERKDLLEQRGQDYYISILKLQKREPLETICYELFTQFGFSSAQIPHILGLLQAESGHFVVSATHRILRDRDFLIITTIPTQSADIIVIDSVPCTVDTQKYQFKFSIENTPKKIPADSSLAYIDMSKVTLPVLLRKWRIGDYFYPLGMGMKKKKISRYLIDQKVALHDKDHVMVLEINKRIAWLTGMRLDERFKVKDTTDKVLKIEMKPL